MFDKKSHFSLNKRRKDAIVYASVSGEIILTKDDFPTKEDFEKWKSWSDIDYKTSEQNERAYYDHLSLKDGEECFAEEEEEKSNGMDRERKCAQLMMEVRKVLTAAQYRRLWMYEVEGMTAEQIAKAEGIAHQNVSKSIRAARKKVLKLKQYLMVR